MLILTRKTNQSLMIGDDIEIKIVQVKGDQIMIGINAPAEVGIYRKEVYLAIKEENAKAGQVEAKSIQQLLFGGEK